MSVSVEEAKYMQILIDNGILDKVYKVSICVPEDLIGEHFGSIVEYVTVQFEDSNVEDLHLFIKKKLDMEYMEAMNKLFDRVMIKEGFFLTTLVQDLKNLCIERIGNATLARQIEEMYPKTYHADEGAITMENITKHGFKMADKKDKQDLGHARMVLPSLARLHALSHVRISESGGSANYLEQNPHLFSMFHDPAAAPFMNPMFDSPMNALSVMLKESRIPGSSELLQKLTKYKGKWFSTMQDLLTTKTVLPVVNHGDAWNNNMMFSTGKDARVIMFDLQCCTIGSPALDLGCYIYNSLKSEVRQQWKTLLQIYYDTLKETVELFGVEFKLTFEELLNEFRTAGKTGIFTGLIVLCGLDAMKNHDTESSGFVMQDPEAFDQLMTTFIAENTDKVDGIVSGVMSLIDDFELVEGTM